MEIRRLLELNDEQARKMFEWEMDPGNRFFCSPCKGPDAPPRYVDWSELQRAANVSPAIRYGIFEAGQFVGEFNYHFDHPVLHKKDPRTAWIGIGIGEASARGKGFGLAAMKYLEEEIRKDGGKRIELGVFAFNEPAIRLYQKLQYRHFHTNPDFTWWEGAWWADLRHEKILVS